MNTYGDKEIITKKWRSCNITIFTNGKNENYGDTARLLISKSIERVQNYSLAKRNNNMASTLYVFLVSTLE